MVAAHQILLSEWISLVSQRINLMFLLRTGGKLLSLLAAAGIKKDIQEIIFILFFMHWGLSLIFQGTRRI